MQQYFQSQIHGAPDVIVPDPAAAAASVADDDDRHPDAVISS